ncbi:malectin domain-containing carbohydrate-binding protein [Pedobacter sp. PLR]|uniref:glycoside hydrolase family 2 TIM barrel-domain containing protein n=1 Tax=Pedobacter sp. PLR TaxID=2994465 RepID=UPI002248064A|nr:glycoside hydrolase family 2 TIM barrel-domain containing protein [Pedobacter sp. PLR]MCX2452594.1 malectin domain-containing carbohydrate-binding protein [Pedobacter sp. PLR]
MTCFKHLCLFLLLFFFAGASFSKSINSNPGRQYIGLNDQWSFSKDEQIREDVNLPHTWNAKDVMDDAPGYYRGTGWYKRTLKTSPAMKGKMLFLCFDGVNQEAEVYVNGQLAGKHAGGYTRFIIPVTKFLKFNSDFKNEVMVKVSNRYQEDIAPLTADFTFFGGIYRKVGLLITDPVHFYNGDHGADGIYISTPQVSAESAQVALKYVLENAAGQSRKVRLNTALYNKEGRQVVRRSIVVTLKGGEKKTILMDLPKVDKPELWSPDSPVLYRVVSSILDAGGSNTLDELTHSIGFRWFKFDAEKGFFLNGAPLKLMGASRHQDYEGLGNAVPDALQIRDVELLKEMGGNFLRVAHYPQDPVILETCDRLGILASVEIPIVNGITESLAFSENCRNMQVEMIRQNYNHPSVVMWAYMNEVLLRPKFGNDKPRQELYFKHVFELAQSLEELTRKEDNSRYTMMALHGDFDRYHKVGLTKIPMVIGWNLYQGWYGGSLADFGRFLDKHHRELPDKPLLITEFGADADPRIRSFKPIRFDKSVEYAIKFSQVYLNEMLSRPFVSGGMVWNLADFNSETREETMPHINNKGLLTLGRQPKDTYYLYQAYLLKQPFIKIASKNWTARTGIADSSKSFSTQPVQVATNLKSLELFLNGKSLGIKESTDRICTWDVPFSAGKHQLKAVAAQHPELSDLADIEFTLMPYLFTEKTFSTLNVLLGSERYFIDEKNHVLWTPDQPYRKGAWGYIGGTAFRGGNNRMTYGSDKNITGTDSDPVYQTQQVGIAAYKMDVPDGFYELSLYFSELQGGAEKEALAYNLDDAQQKEISDQRVFNLNVNGHEFLKDFNISEEYGYTRAAQKLIRIQVANGKGIVLDFNPIKGKPVLNALSLRKLN